MDRDKRGVIAGSVFCMAVLLAAGWAAQHYVRLQIRLGEVRQALNSALAAVNEPDTRLSSRVNRLYSALENADDLGEYSWEGTRLTEMHICYSQLDMYRLDLGNPLRKSVSAGNSELRSALLKDARELEHCYVR
jgi:hypothetical protein